MPKNREDYHRGGGVRLLRDGDAVYTDDLVGTGIPLGTVAALEDHFLQTVKPSNLTLRYCQFISTPPRCAASSKSNLSRLYLPAIIRTKNRQCNEAIQCPFTSVIRELVDSSIGEAKAIPFEIMPNLENSSLRQAVELFDLYQYKIDNCDQAIARVLDALGSQTDQAAPQPVRRQKLSRNTPNINFFY